MLRTMTDVYGMCSNSVGYYLKRENGTGLGDKAENTSSPRSKSFVELSLRTVFAKANSTMLLNNDSLSTPHPSASVSAVKGLFYSLFKPSKNIWNLHKRRNMKLSGSDKLLLQGFLCNSYLGFCHNTGGVF